MRTVRDVEPKTATSTFTSFWALINKFKFNVALRPQGPQGLFGTGSPARLPRLSHSSWALYSSRVSFYTFFSFFFFFFFFFFFSVNASQGKRKLRSLTWRSDKSEAAPTCLEPLPPPNPPPPPTTLPERFPLSLTYSRTIILFPSVSESSPKGNDSDMSDKADDRKRSCVSPAPVDCSVAVCHSKHGGRLAQNWVHTSSSSV